MNSGYAHFKNLFLPNKKYFSETLICASEHVKDQLRDHHLKVTWSTMSILRSKVMFKGQYVILFSNKGEMTDLDSLSNYLSNNIYIFLN